MRARAAIKALMPAGLDRFLEWQRRFREIGFSPQAALRASGSRRYKAAYQASRIAQLPPDLRRGRIRTVIDVGANHGQWASAILTVASPERIEIIEPNPEAFDVLRSRLGSHPGATLHPVALGAERGTLTLNVTTHSDFASFLEVGATIRRYYPPEASRVIKQVPVSVETLDGLLASRLEEVDLLKIDVQGFERRVLAGGMAVLRRTRVVLMEVMLVSHYGLEDSFESLTGILSSAGFEAWDFSPPFRAANGRALWLDAAFVHRDLVPGI